MYSVSVLLPVFAVCFFLVCLAWQKLCKSPGVMDQTTEYTGTPREVYTPRYSHSLRRKVWIITARICADHFERVIIIDPEIEDPEKPKTRILQYNAMHVFLSLFVEGARRLWPNFDAEMITAGGRQGFSKAIINGMGLNSLLHAVTSNSGVTCLPRDFSARYFKNSCHTMNALWDATRLHDYGSPHCVPIDGETKDIGRIARWFERKLISAASKDEEVASALWHVRHLFASERVFLAPTVFWKVLSTRSLF
ncbi:hypothetical protein MSAN_00811100 [Mycena sanguinolenta]|uniref:Uncharacterized protein n=1 Tax=Mycena sanguinolenta TaxID=230812 RepID=A0A8H7DC65_9AGAR|nr:hypothetical protein MSAN_00811100 [Mycena sanguinolenta]